MPLLFNDQIKLVCSELGSLKKQDLKRLVCAYRFPKEIV
jgi:hypothetical protein